jgi:hypothetical protein
MLWRHHGLPGDAMAEQKPSMKSFTSAKPAHVAGTTIMFMAS